MASERLFPPGVEPEPAVTAFDFDYMKPLAWFTSSLAGFKQKLEKHPAVNALDYHAPRMDLTEVLARRRLKPFGRSREALSRHNARRSAIRCVICCSSSSMEVDLREMALIRTDIKPPS